MKKALGKGLSALIPDSYSNDKAGQVDTNKPVGSIIAQTATSGFQVLSLSQIKPNPNQPRQDFSPDGIAELAQSIKEKGLLQPIVVKKVAEHDYMIICGERRYRAARLCGLTQVPVVIKEIADKELMEWALIENIQREDLNPMEEAEAYLRIAEDGALSQEQVAKKVGKDRSTVANTMRLAKLPIEVQEMLITGEITAGHARALVGLLTPEHQRQLAKRIKEETLSVRQVETLVNQGKEGKRRAKKARHLKPETIDLENRLKDHFGTQVKIFPKKNQTSGRIEIPYYSLDDLDRILQKLELPTAP